MRFPQILFSSYPKPRHLVAEMQPTGKVAEIFGATILPHEGRQIYIGNSSLYVLRFSTYNLIDVAVLVPATTELSSSFMCRCVAKWLMRDTENVLKWDAALIEPTILLAAPESELDAIEADLTSRGASLHLIDMGSDLLGSIIASAIRALLMRLDESDPSFRTTLSGETERLADLGVFNSTAGGDMRDVLLLASWVGHRFSGRLGVLSSLELLNFGSSLPSAVSPLVDGWVDQLFGAASTTQALDTVPLSRAYGDLLSIDSSGGVNDGMGDFTLLSIGGNTDARCGIMSSPLEVGNRPRMLVSSSTPVPSFDANGVRVPLTEVISINLDDADGAVVQVAAGADLLIIEIDGTSLNQSRSGVDPIVGFYNEELSEWQYTDDGGGAVYTPILEAPYYCPDLNNASATILRVLKSTSAQPAPQPAIREIKIVLLFNGPVDGSFQVKIRQRSFGTELGFGSDAKWPTGFAANEYGETVERVNFSEWQPSSTSSFAIYRIETYNHTLWDVDGTDAANELALTANYGAARSLLRKFQAWREMSG